MLRRKLLIIFGSLVILLAVMALGGVWMLAGVLDKLDHVNSEAMVIVRQVGKLNLTLTAIEIDLYHLQLGRQRHLDDLIDRVDSAKRMVAEIGEYYVLEEPGAKPFYQDLLATFPEFERRVSSLATAQDPALARQCNVDALTVAMAMRESVGQIDREVGEHAREEHLELADRFRWLVLGFALGGLLLINISILVLLRAASMVLRPVSKLVETSRQLTQRGPGDGGGGKHSDEFTELSEAFSDVAERLHNDEQSRMETLRQTALTLNHELNNAMMGIELQLQVLRRRAGGGEDVQTGLNEIREALRRMANTVESLKHIRRIVLTDYIAGIKMLDLTQSTQDAPDDPGNATE